GAVARARRIGWGVALDDVGAEPRATSLMPFVQPDVIKVDLELLSRRSDEHVARVVNAVLAEAERTGATILAEGIATKDHLALARGIGATVGQGYFLGAPDSLPGTVKAPSVPIPFMPPSPPGGLTP